VTTVCEEPQHGHGSPAMHQSVTSLRAISGSAPSDNPRPRIRVLALPPVQTEAESFNAADGADGSWVTVAHASIRTKLY
jgi:hypothetical protein